MIFLNSLQKHLKNTFCNSSLSGETIAACPIKGSKFMISSNTDLTLRQNVHKQLVGKSVCSSNLKFQTLKNIIHKIVMLALTSACILQLSGCATGMDPENTPAQGAQNQVNYSTAPKPAADNAATQPPKPKTARIAPPPTQPISIERERQTSERLSPIRIQSINADSVMEVKLANDLWERIRKGYAMPNLDTDLVRDREQWYATKGVYLTNMTERSSKYLYYIVEELEIRKMPTELALLPFIESSFNPQAVSSAKASGMWQFMPKTGKNFDLKQNAFRDDRRDVLASTRAALDYLQKLYLQFGDWHLALAAYNWGEGNVNKAIQRSKSAGLSGAYTELNMPVETRMYVPKLQAVKDIVANPSQFGITLADIPNHPYFQTVPLPRDMDVRVAAHLADVTMEDFTALNPSAHRPVLLAGGTPQILLPWDNAEIFQRNYEAFGGKLATWTAWVAPTTMKVSEAARRNKMSEADFRSINNIPPKMMIKAGSALLIPRGDKIKTDVSVEIADSGQVSLAPEITLKKSQLRVTKKDTLESFAIKHRIKAVQLAEWNQLGVNAALKPGQVLVIYTAQGNMGKRRPSRDNTRDTRVARATNRTH
jgi:membrane-bound lytic murein transglycosylase D